MLKYLLICCAIFLAPAATAEETPLPNPKVVIKTSEGDITLRLFRDKAPLTVDNFLAYVDAGFYNGTIFHRVIPNFMIQGGGFLPDMTEKPTNDPVKNESKNRVHNARGTIAMARTTDPHSATAQFFINVKDNDFLNHSGKNMQGWGYTVFGKVSEGEDVLNKIRAVPTGSRGGHQDVPTDDVIIESVEVVED